MSARATSPRAIVLAAVFALHAVALLALLAETRTRAVRGAAEASPLLVWFFEPRERPRPIPPPPRRPPREPGVHPDTALAPTSEPPPATAPPAPGAIDWAAEATASANRQTELNAQRNRQARALTPTPSRMFAKRAPYREFAWDYSRTHRVEPIGGLSTVIHLNDQCAIVLFVIVPFAGGCALEKPPARGDLFDHMHDAQP